MDSVIPSSTIAPAPPAMVEGDTTIVPGEIRHLLPPAHVIPARTVRQHDRKPLTVFLVVELNTVYMRRWHMSYPKIRLAGGGVRVSPTIYSRVGGWEEEHCIIRTEEHQRSEGHGAGRRSLPPMRQSAGGS